MTSHRRERNRVAALADDFRSEFGQTETDDGAELSDYDQHPADSASDTAEREKDLGILEQLERELVELQAALERIVGEGWGWQHIEEGEENAPSHIRAALMGPQVVIPLRDGELALGTWQGIFFCELDGPRTRSLYVTILQ